MNDSHSAFSLSGGLSFSFENLDRLPLPFGDPPESLADNGEEQSAPQEDLARRVRALMENADIMGDGSPREAATCLHEAGRILDRRLMCPALAWTCHSRALAIDGDFAPALGALRRLARRSGDYQLLLKVLETNLDAPMSVVEESLLTAESGGRHMALGKWSEAEDAFRESSRARSDFVLPYLFRLGLAARGGDDQELIDCLERMESALGDKEFAEVARLEAALIEERLGRIDEGISRLGRVSAQVRSVGETYLLSRLLLRNGSFSGAADQIEVLVTRLGDGEIPSSLERVAQSLRTLDINLSGEEATARPEEMDGGVWELDLIAALRRGDHAGELGSVERALGTVKDEGLRSALALQAAAALSAQGEKLDSAPVVPLGAIWTEALEKYLGIDTRPGDAELLSAASENPVRAMVAGISGGEFEGLEAALSEISRRVSSGNETWDLAVARAVVRCNLMGNPLGALEILREATTDLSRVPLADLTRLHDRSPSSLAAVSLAEAELAHDDIERSWLLSRAAAHTEKFDSTEAARLHREALDLNPTCGVSLAALQREGTDHSTMGSVLVAAAESCSTDKEKGLNLVRAGMRFLAAGESQRALEALGSALALVPGDRGLRRTVVRLAADSPESFEVDDLLQADREGVPYWESMYMGLLGLAPEPSVAAKWFDAAIEAVPESPFGRVGLTRASLKGGRKSEESSRMLERLRNAQTERDEAWVYLRLAEIDARYGDDPASAVLSLMTVQEKLPGHRSTLGRLAVYLARQGRMGELTQVMAGLASTLSDDRDGSFAVNEAIRGSATATDLAGIASQRDPGSALSLARLEATSEDVATGAACLEKLSTLDDPAVVHQSRFADALEDMGKTAESLDLRMRLLSMDPGSTLDLLGVERKMREVQDFAGLEKTLVRLAGATELEKYRVERFLEASRVALENLSDPGLAAHHCLEVLRIEPGNDEAFARGRTILEDRNDLAMLDRFLGARVVGVDESEVKVTLLSDLAEVRIKAGEREGAKESLRQALEMVPADVRLHRWLAAIHREDSEWSEAIDHLMEAAKNNADPQIGIQVFFDLGVLYMDHSERLELAEKSFVKVLGWNREHFAAMERLSVLYERVGNWARCIQALEHLVKMADEPGTRVEKTIELARVLESGMNRPRDAEAVLSEIRRVSPLDNRPVEFLAGMYTRQRDAMALNVLLDQALNTNALALVEQPASIELNKNIHSILTMKAEDAVATLSIATLTALGASVEGMTEGPSVEARWNVGGRVGEPALAEFLFPKDLTPGLRETLKAVEEPVARILGIGIKQMGLGKDSRLDKRHALSAAFSRLSASFGVKAEPATYVADVNEIIILPGSQHVVVVPRVVAANDTEDVVNYVASYSLMIIRSGLSLATVLDEQRLARLVAAVVKLSVPSFALPGVSQEEIEREASAFRQVLSSKHLAHIQPFAFDCSSSLEKGNLKENILAAGRRAGFVGAGSLTGALTGVFVAAGRSEGQDIATLPGLGRMLAFVFSKDHLDLRKRMGL